jgi:hypothetical protein
LLDSEHADVSKGISNGMQGLNFIVLVVKEDAFEGIFIED